jgi:hypothetical protein
MSLFVKAAVAAALAIALSPVASASDTTGTEGWKKSLVIDVTTTQTSYSDSWVGGEAGSVNWVGNLNGAAERQLSNQLNFRSTLKLSFGQTLTQDTAGNWSKPRKSTDLIDWENLARFTFGWHLDPYAAFRLETQFMDASVAEKKRFLSPLKLTESAGLAHRFYERGNDHITSRFGLALRQIITSVITDTAFNTKSETATDHGLESVTDVDLTLGEGIKYTGKLTLYRAFFYSKKDEVAGTEAEDYWKAVDLNWENTVSASISKVIAINFYTQLLYDKEVSKKGRLKETLGIGFVFKMI